jgi:predicted alpha/beta superfamily hydrolase
MTAAFPNMFPRTKYFEIDSKKAGARYAIWVTVPEGYERASDKSYAAIYMPDGNWNVSIAAGLCDLDQWDFMDPYQPTIQISVGYPEAEAARTLVLRARDLLPPNEALLPNNDDNIEASLKAGLLDREGADLYRHYLHNPGGDRFLAFITEELHPIIVDQYRIRTEATGLFGHSYGGLFAAYAALQEDCIFSALGASSPGIVPRRSVLFQLHADAASAGGFPERHLHMTVAAREVTDPGPYQSAVGEGTVEFMRAAGTGALKGLNFSARIFEEETHITVKPTALYSFMRRFYRRNE